MDKQIKALELAEAEAKKRASEAERTVCSKVDHAVTRMQRKVDEKDRELWEARQEAQKLRRQIRNTETMIGKIPLELREKLLRDRDRERGQKR